MLLNGVTANVSGFSVSPLITEPLSTAWYSKSSVKELRFVGEADELGRWELKPNYRALGPRLGKRMPTMAQAVAALDAQAAATRLRAGRSVGVVVGGGATGVGLPVPAAEPVVAGGVAGAGVATVLAELCVFVPLLEMRRPATGA